MTAALPEHIMQSLQDICQSHNAHLVEVVVRGSLQKRVLEIYVDTEAGITLDECGAISNSIGEMLESANVFSGQYRLEVSSPGADKPLRYQWQYRRHIGRLFNVTLADGTQKQGRLKDIGDTSFTLEQKLLKREIANVEIPFDAVKRAIVEFEF